MNRMGDVLLRPDLSLPHTRGDEPNAEIVRFNKDGVCPGSAPPSGVTQEVL